jgi:hypothetical protein
MFSSILARHRRVLKLFSSREAAGQALDHLVLSGFPIAQIFLLGHGWSEDQPRQPYLPVETYGTVTGTATGLRKGLLIGNLAGGTTGLLLGAGMLALPGVGQLALSAAITFVLLSGGVCTAAGGLAGALIGLGLTSAQVNVYKQQISEGSFLLIVEGSPDDINLAQRLLSSCAS